MLVVERATWPMIGLTLVAVASAVQQPFDPQTWSLVAAKFFVPFALFHLAGLVFREERRIRQFEVFALVILAYLSFTSIAFLVDAKSLIFPRFILDESLGYHADRARGPLLQAVANGVSLNLLGVLALHALLRGRIRGLRAGVLLASLPVAILATMTRAVWVSFALSVALLIFRSHNRRLRRFCVAVAIVGSIGISRYFVDDHRRALADRLHESGPLDFRQAVYAGGWQMFLEKPLTGWGVNQMPAELARHVSGYKEKKDLDPHNAYLELLVEHGILGLGLYAWLMSEIFMLGRGLVPRAERDGVLNQQFHAMWPVLLFIYWANATVVVMNYQFVNSLLFTMAGMLAAQHRRAVNELASKGPSIHAFHASVA